MIEVNSDIENNNAQDNTTENDISDKENNKRVKINT